MSASQPGNMRGPRVTTPLLLLLLLLLTTLTGTVVCQEDTQEDSTDDSGDTETAEALQVDFNSTLAPDVSTTEEPVDENIEEGHGSGVRHDPRIHVGISETTESPSLTDETTATVMEDEGLDLLIILIPAILVVLIVSMVVCGIFIHRRCNKKSKNEDLRKEDPHLDESSTEKVPMPMFEEDVPSVLEVEMEELDQWMKKDGETAEDSEHI